MISNASSTARRTWYAQLRDDDKVEAGSTASIVGLPNSIAAYALGPLGLSTNLGVRTRSMRPPIAPASLWPSDLLGRGRWALSA